MPTYNGTAPGEIAYPKRGNWARTRPQAVQTLVRIMFQKGPKILQKEGEFLKNGTRQPKVAREKTGQTGTNARQAGNQKYRAPVRQNTTRIRRETNEKMPRQLNLSEHFITLASVI